MSFDLKTARFVVWGYKTHLHTHGFIHWGLFHALQYMGKEVEWLDAGSNVNVDRANTFFISNHDVVGQLPLREDCFYLSHGFVDHPDVLERFRPYKWLSWNVQRDFLYAKETSGPEVIWLDEDIPFVPSQRHLFFRWAADLSPSEIEANKVGAVPLKPDVKVIYYVGSFWHVNAAEVAAFGQACKDNDVEFIHLGAGQTGAEYSYLGHSNVVSPEENVRLIRASRWAVSITGGHHLLEGYINCRIFKNIAYGQFGVTNSKRVNDLFENKLVFDPDPYSLFKTAEDRLKNTSVKELHDLMDFVAEKHTYKNRLEAIFKAVEMVL